MLSRKNSLMIALATMVAVVVVMLFSSIYIGNHIHHDCSGEDCAVCCVLAQCSSNLKDLIALAIVAFVSFILNNSMQGEVQSIKTVYLNCSLISQKVRMNN